MSGYLNRFIDIPLDDISGPGCFIQIHNPRVLPPSLLEPSTPVKLTADGQPVDPHAAEMAGYEVLSRLIRDWRVYDASVLEDDQPLLDLPATAEKIRRLPLEIILRLNKEMEKATPNPH